jgi:hypothetical protein
MLWGCWGRNARQRSLRDAGRRGLSWQGAPVPSGRTELLASLPDTAAFLASLPEHRRRGPVHDLFRCAVASQLQTGFPHVLRCSPAAPRTQVDRARPCRTSAWAAGLHGWHRRCAGQLPQDPCSGTRSRRERRCCANFHPSTIHMPASSCRLLWLHCVRWVSPSIPVTSYQTCFPGSADYSGSLVLQLPIAEAAHVALQLQPTGAACMEDANMQARLACLPSSPAESPGRVARLCAVGRRWPPRHDAVVPKDRTISSLCLRAGRDRRAQVAQRRRRRSESFL